MELVADAARLDAETALDQALNAEHQHQLNAASDAFLFGITEPRIVIGVNKIDFCYIFKCHVSLPISAVISKPF